MNSWEGGSLRDLIDRAIPGFWAHRIASEGPDLKVHANHLVKLSMALFELTTNAVKYGALSNNAGRVEIRWLRSGRAIAEVSGGARADRISGAPDCRGRIALVWTVLLVFCHVLARAAEPFEAELLTDHRVIASGRRT